MECPVPPSIIKLGIMLLPAVPYSLSGNYDNAVNLATLKHCLSVIASMAPKLFSEDPLLTSAPNDGRLLPPNLA